jgi:hypothetical protein
MPGSRIDDLASVLSRRSDTHQDEVTTSPSPCLASAACLGPRIDLRSPGDGNSLGSVIAIADSQKSTADGCTTQLTFTISPSVGYFEVVDETVGTMWGPTSYQQVAQSGFVYVGTY